MTPFYRRVLTAVGTTAEIGDIARSASCGAFADASGAVTQVTNLSVTAKVSGRSAYKLELVNDNSGSTAIFGGSHPSSGDFKFFVYRDGVKISEQIISMLTAATNQFPANLAFTDLDAPEGTYTYTVRVQRVTASTTVIIEYFKLIGYEL